MFSYFVMYRIHFWIYYWNSKYVAKLVGITYAVRLHNFSKLRDAGRLHQESWQQNNLEFYL